MVISPILYIGSLSIRAHIHLNVFDFQACTKKQHDAITAYRPFVFDALPFQNIHARHVDRDKLRTVARSWVSAAERGQLQALLPVHVNDFVREGIKQEVFRSADSLGLHLISVAKYEASAGNGGRAASDLVLSLRLFEILKYSDPYAVAHAGLQQRVALESFSEISDKLPPKVRASFVQSLVELRAAQKPLDQMVRWMKQMYNTERVRAGQEVLPFEEVDRYLSEPSSAPEAGLAVFTSAASMKWASAGEVPPLLGELRMASHSQTSFLEHLEQIVASSDALPAN